MKLAIGAALACALSAMAGAAAAADYIAVGPAQFRGQEFEVGQKVQVGPRQPLALMHVSGDVTRSWGDAGGWVTVPAHARAPEANDWIEILRVLVGGPPPEVRTFGGRRGNICPAASELKSFAVIMGVGRSPACEAVAREALEAYVARQLAAQPAGV